MKVYIVVILACALSLMQTSCGVKGDPLPPENAPRLGRGTPTYSNAVESIEFENQKIQKTEEDEESDDE